MLGLIIEDDAAPMLKIDTEFFKATFHISESLHICLNLDNSHPKWRIYIDEETVYSKDLILNSETGIFSTQTGRDDMDQNLMVRLTTADCELLTRTLNTFINRMLIATESEMHVSNRHGYPVLAISFTADDILNHRAAALAHNQQ